MTKWILPKSSGLLVTVITHVILWTIYGSSVYDRSNGTKLKLTHAPLLVNIVIDLRNVPLFVTGSEKHQSVALQILADGQPISILTTVVLQDEVEDNSKSVVTDCAATMPGKNFVLNPSLVESLISKMRVLKVQKPVLEQPSKGKAEKATRRLVCRRSPIYLACPVARHGGHSSKNPWNVTSSYMGSGWRLNVSGAALKAERPCKIVCRNWLNRQGFLNLGFMHWCESFGKFTANAIAFRSSQWQCVCIMFNGIWRNVDVGRSRLAGENSDGCFDGQELESILLFCFCIIPIFVGKTDDYLYKG